jgi:hypothetical protein
MKESWNLFLSFSEGNFFLDPSVIILMGSTSMMSSTSKKSPSDKYISKTDGNQKTKVKKKGGLCGRNPPLILFFLLLFSGQLKQEE